jgi:hypothetical protein
MVASIWPWISPKASCSGDISASASLTVDDPDADLFFNEVVERLVGLGEDLIEGQGEGDEEDILVIFVDTRSISSFV